MLTVTLHVVSAVGRTCEVPMRKIVCLTFLAIVLLMFAEYRFIMHNLRPYREEGGTVYIEVFGMVDTYYAEPAGSIH